MTVLVDVLAVHRLTRLATADTLTAPVRNRLIADAYRRADRFDPDVNIDWTEYAMADEDAPRLAVLLTCRWCASMWIAATVVLIRRRIPRAWSPIARLLALSTASTLVAGLEQ